MTRRSLVVGLVALAALSTAGVSGAEERTSSGSAPEDETIPWRNLPAKDSDFQLGAPERREVPDDAPTCRAKQLDATLPNWTPKGDHDDGTLPSPANGLVGYVSVRNHSKHTCVLQGEVPTTFAGQYTGVGIRYSQSVNDESRERTTAVGAGEAAELRLDWSAPYCGPTMAQQVLEVRLPQRGGKVLAPVVTPSQPSCFESDVHPELRSVLSASAFDEPAFTTQLDSPLSPVEVDVEGVANAPVGGKIVYFVTIHNPTSADMPLSPCPGYFEERISTGVADRPGVSKSSLHRLNCRAASVIPANATLRFEMRTRVPAALTPGQTMTVLWRFVARALDPNVGLHYGSFTVTIT